MSVFEAQLVFWSLASIQLIGLLSACLARLSEGSVRQVACQRFFLACLLLVGLGTIASLTLIPAYWVASGTTLSLMVLAATCDFRRCPQSMAC